VNKDSAEGNKQMVYKVKNKKYSFLIRS
jgi:hypothetical protein